MAGKDWRYIIVEPEDVMPCVVNAHSMVHDNTWSLVTTVYSSGQLEWLDETQAISHFDPWIRSMLWTIRVAELLQSGGNEFSSIIDDMKSRIKLQQVVHGRIEQVCNQIDGVFRDMFGRKPDFPDYFLVVIADWELPDGKIASYNYADTGPCGTLAISPRAFENGIQDAVIKHELCHAALGKMDDPHGDEFQKLADWLGVPKKNQN